MSTAELSSNPKKIMYYYFNEWVNQFDDPRSGLAILYYLSDYSAHRDEDIRNISFCMSIEKRQMEKFGLIKSDRNNSPSFEFAHNYLADVAKHYCKDSKDFSETIAENIDFYREAATFPAASVRTESQKRTANYWSEKNRFLVNACLTVLLIGSGVVCVRHSLSLFMSPSTWMVFTLTAILINCLLSTLYVYSFCVDYLIIYGGPAILPLTACGAISIILAIAYPNLWAILLSIESFILAGTVFSQVELVYRKKRSGRLQKPPAL